MNQTQLHAALLSRMAANPRLGDRRQYIGASEVGNCLRRVVANKLNPEPFDDASMGRMLAGRAMENEVVQLVRIALNGSLRNTGRNQMDVAHPDLPFRAHPDGRIVGEDGDGVLEVKTASTALFKRYKSEGLPQSYIDQVQTQMGLSCLKWALVVLVSRENLAEVETFHLDFSPVCFESLVERARLAANAISRNTLPDGEPDRGYCFNCPFNQECPDYQGQRKASLQGLLPESQRLEMECQVEELAGLESNLEPMQQRISELRERLKQHLVETGIGKVVLDGSTLQLVTSSRTSLDAKAVQREAPDIYKRFLKTNVFSTLRVNFQGASQ